MNEYNQKIAVITGAASGIGRALAQKCASEKMRLVIADIEEIALNTTHEELLAMGADSVAVLTDVTKEKDILALAEKTFSTFGVPHFLFNNAGVGGTAEPIWEMPIERLQWTLDVNLFSIMHSIRAFIPVMLEAGQEAHIINTASMAGFYTSPFFANYQLSKHGVVVLSECLYHDLQQHNSNINVSVLCPGWVSTNVLNGVRNYPDVTQKEIAYDNFSQEDVRWILNFARNVKKGMSPNQVAEITFQAIRENQFYIFTHPEFKEVIRDRMRAVLNEKKPVRLEV